MAQLLTQTYVPEQPVDELILHPRNPRRGDVDRIARSINTNGFYGTVMVQRSTGYVIYGNHRIAAARKVGLTAVPAIWVDVDDMAAARMLVADNATSDAATYDDTSLVEVLALLADSDIGLEGSGWENAEYDALLATIEAAANDPYSTASTGTVLDATDVGLGDPRHAVVTGDIYRLGPTPSDLNGDPAINGPHHLVVDSVMTGWPRWSPLLIDGVLFCPYPGLYLTLTIKAFSTSLLLVQPDHYLAGHLLDKHAGRFGADAVVKL